MTYTAPLADMRFALREVAGLQQVASLPGYEHATDDTVDAVLEEAAKLAGNGLAPLNRDGDKVGAKLENGVTVNVPEFIEQGTRVRVNPNTGEYLDRAKD